MHPLGRDPRELRHRQGPDRRRWVEGVGCRGVEAPAEAEAERGRLGRRARAREEAAVVVATGEGGAISR